MKLAALDRKAIFFEFGLEQLSSDQQDKIWQLLEEIFNLRLLDAILTSLSFEEQKKFLELLVDQEEEAARFVKDRVTNFEMLVATVVANVKKDFAQDVAKAKQHKR